MPAARATAEPTPVGDADALAGDVRAFAAQLGLASGAPGSGGGFDDSDFLPSKARQPLASAAKGKKDTVKKAGKSSQQQKRQREDGEDHEEHGDEEQQEQGPPPKRKGREWREGVGPRPGALTGKSLQGKDEHQVWFEAAAALPPLGAPPSEAGWPVADDVLVEQRRAHCEALVENEAAAFERQMKGRSAADARWLQQVKSAGTTQDKIAAMTLLVRESALANLRSLDHLLSWVQKRSGGREVVRHAIEALQELFLTVLLPGRKLRMLDQQPLQAVQPGTKDGDRQLLYWFVEDAVKKRYNLFVTALEECSRDNLEFLKEKATKTIYDLLVKKPEGEARLLSALCNKLGDPNRKVASKAGFLLSQLLLEHPVMKPVVVREVEKFLFRSGLQDRGRYYAITFMNQLALSHRESEGGGDLAKKLIDIYFTLFKMLIDGHIGRAATVKKAQEEKFEKDKAKFRSSHSRQQKQGGGRGGRSGGSRGRGGRGGRDGGRTAVVKYPVAPKKPLAEELDARMLGALMTGVRRAFPYVPAEDVEPLIQRHSEHLFRMVHTAPFSVSLQALLLMFQLLSGREAVSDRFYRALYAVLLMPDGPVNSARAPMFLSLLFKAMKADVSVRRVAAFAKRLLQVALEASANWACGCLFLLSEVLKAQPALWSAVLQPEEYDDDEADGGSAKRLKRAAVAGYHSSDDDEEADKAKTAAAAKKAANAPPRTLSAKALDRAWDEEDSGDEELAGNELAADGPAAIMPSEAQDGAPPTKGGRRGAEARWPPRDHYDMEKREPQHCHGERSCWWELSVLSSHFHPSVTAMARTLLAGVPVVYDGDPTRDHGLAAFLDKFLLKKPKVQARGTSLMQPLPHARADVQVSTVGSGAFIALSEATVAPADLFFHKFYNLQSVKARRVAKDAARAAVDDEAEPGEFDDDEDEGIDKFLEAHEGVGDDLMGDPDAGYDYEGLAMAMARGELGDDVGGGLEDGGSDADDLEDDDDEGVDEEGDDGEEGEDDETGLDLEESGSDLEGVESDDGNDDFDVDDEAAGGSDGGGGDDEELRGVNVLDLPSPSTSDEVDDVFNERFRGAGRAGGEAHAADRAAGSGKATTSSKPSRNKSDGPAAAAGGRRQAEMEAREFEFSDDSDDKRGEGGEDEDDELAAMFGGGGGSDDDGDEEDPASPDPDGDGGASDEEEEPPSKRGRTAAGSSKASSRGGGSNSRGGGPLFAAAEDYAHLFEEPAAGSQPDQGVSGDKKRDRPAPTFSKRTLEASDVPLSGRGGALRQQRGGGAGGRRGRGGRDSGGRGGDRGGDSRGRGGDRGRGRGGGRGGDRGGGREGGRGARGGGRFGGGRGRQDSKRGRAGGRGGGRGRER